MTIGSRYGLWRPPAAPRVHDQGWTCCPTFLLGAHNSGKPPAFKEREPMHLPIARHLARDRYLRRVRADVTHTGRNDRTAFAATDELHLRVPLTTPDCPCPHLAVRQARIPVRWKKNMDTVVNPGTAPTLHEEPEHTENADNTVPIDLLTRWAFAGRLVCAARAQRACVRVRQ